MARLLGASVIVPSSSSSSIDGDGGSTSLPSARSVHRNFQGLTVLWTCPRLAGRDGASILHDRAISGGRLHGGTVHRYTLSALVCSAPITRALAPRAAMVLAMLLFAVYLLSFLLALLLPVPGAAHWLSVIGGACAGFAAAVLWTAQGSYFALSAKALAICTGKTSEATTMQLASLFARYYLVRDGHETHLVRERFSIRPTATSNSGTNGTNITAVALQKQHGQAPMDTMSAHGKSMEVETLIVLSAIALVSTSASLLTYDLRDATDKGAGDGAKRCTPQVLQPLMVACRFFSAHRAELLLLLPFNVAFGFTVAFVINFIDARIATANLGEAAVPVLTGVTAGVAALAAHPMSVAARKTRATLVIAVSAACQWSPPPSSSSTMHCRPTAAMAAALMGASGRAVHVPRPRAIVLGDRLQGAVGVTLWEGRAGCVRQPHRPVWRLLVRSIPHPPQRLARRCMHLVHRSMCDGRRRLRAA